MFCYRSLDFWFIWNPTRRLHTTTPTNTRHPQNRTVKEATKVDEETMCCSLWGMFVDKQKTWRHHITLITVVMRKYLFSFFKRHEIYQVPDVFVYLHNSDVLNMLLAVESSIVKCLSRVALSLCYKIFVIKYISLFFSLVESWFHLGTSMSQELQNK